MYRRLLLSALSVDDERRNCELAFLLVALLQVVYPFPYLKVVDWQMDTH